MRRRRAVTEPKTVAGAYAKIEAHEDICALRYKAINDTLGELKATAKSHVRAAWGIVIALLGWMAIQLYNDHTRPEAPSAAPVAASQGPQ